MQVSTHLKFTTSYKLKLLSHVETHYPKSGFSRKVLLRQAVQLSAWYEQEAQFTEASQSLQLSTFWYVSDGHSLTHSDVASWKYSGFSGVDRHPVQIIGSSLH